jgi:hypothetical protein
MQSYSKFIIQQQNSLLEIKKIFPFLPKKFVTRNKDLPFLYQQRSLLESRILLFYTNKTCYSKIFPFYISMNVESYVFNLYSYNYFIIVHTVEYFNKYYIIVRLFQKFLLIKNDINFHFTRR